MITLDKENKFNNFSIFLCIVILFKFISSYFLPINILAGAPHDDTLFYNIGKNLSEFNWLGNYNNLTLIKGPVFPLFLSFSIKFEIPIRLWESFLICSSTIYFIYSVQKFENLNKFFLACLLILIIFDPFQYFSISFRLLREVVYPWYLLLITSQMFLIFGKILNNKKIIFGDVFLLAFFIFLFNFTREEGIWIGPYLISSLILFSVLSYRKKFFKNFIIQFVLFVLVYFSFVNTLKISNYIAYNYYGATIFKDKDYVNGWTSIFRIKQKNRFLTEAPNKETWDLIFKNSDSAKKIKKWIYGPGYKGWAKMGCPQVELNFYINQGKSERLNCNGEMNFGYLMFAFLDAIHLSGFDTPMKKKLFMASLHNDINKYCLKKPENCRELPATMLAPEIWDFKIFLKSFFKMPRALKISTLGHAFIGISPVSSGQFEKIYKIRNDFRSYYFDIKHNEPYKIKDSLINSLNNAKLNKIGYVDTIDYSASESLLISGWFFDKTINRKPKILIILNDKYACKTEPSYIRGDISENVNTGFSCYINFKLTKSSKIKLKVFAIFEEENYELNFTDEVKILLNNNFNEECYLNNNLDVKLAVSKGEFKSGYEHYEKFGKFENRKCKPLFKESINLKKYSYEYSNFSQFFYKFYEYLNKLYGIFGFLCIITAAISFYISFKVKNYFSAFVTFSFGSLLFTRLYLICLLDSVLLAPITVSYLSMASFLVHFLTAYSLINICSFFYEKK